MKYCLGTVQFGMNYGIQGNSKPHETNVFDILSYAIDNGITILDTAAAYGDAEIVIGDYFKSNPSAAKKTCVISKLKSEAFAKEKENIWPEVAIQNAIESINKLGVDRLHAYLFHDASFIYLENAVKALYEVEKAGLTERIGVSVYTPEEAMKALEYPEISVIQIPYNVFDHRLDKFGFFSKAQRQNIDVFARSSLLQGLIMMNANFLPNKVAFAKKYLEEFHRICSEHRISPLSAAIGYVGNKKGIDYVVFGVDNLTQLKEYISLRDTVLSEDLIMCLDTMFENVEEKLVNPVLWK